MEGNICVNSVLETSTVSFLNEGTNPAPVNLLSTRSLLRLCIGSSLSRQMALPAKA